MSDYDIHSCGYYCDRHACIVAQRNELRDKLFEGQAVKTYSGGKPNYTQPIEQEPVGWIGYFQGNIVSFLQDKEQLKQFLGNTKPAGKVVPVYTEPPKPTKLITVGNVLEQAGYVKKKEWVGLTDEDKKQIEIKAGDKSEMTAWEYAQRVGEFTEAKLKEKNT